MNTEQISFMLSLRDGTANRDDFGGIATFVAPMNEWRDHFNDLPTIWLETDDLLYEDDVVGELISDVREDYPDLASSPWLLVVHFNRWSYDAIQELRECKSWHQVRAYLGDDYIFAFATTLTDSVVEAVV